MGGAMRTSRVGGGLALADVRPDPATFGARISRLEQRRRQELLTPITVAMIVLASSGFLPATTPVLVPKLAGSLSAVIAVFLVTIALNRSGRVQLASFLFCLAQLGFYATALFLTPVGTHGQLAATYFTAGNLYYFLADVLPIFACTLLLDMPWPVFVNLIVFALNIVCIYVLRHDPSYDAFVAGLGGPLFLAASVTLGQIVLIVFGLATARTIRTALVSAIRASDLEETNRRIAERQRQLDNDIRIVQEAHARVANGEWVHADLAHMSEVYPVAASLNLMIDRLARLTQEGTEFRQIERGLAVATDMINKIGRGDLSSYPTRTGSVVDGLLAALIQVQGQIGGWIDGFARATQEEFGTQRAALDALAEMSVAGRQLTYLARDATVAPELREVAERILTQADHISQLLRAAEGRQRALMQAMERFQARRPN